VEVLGRLEVVLRELLLDDFVGHRENVFGGLGLTCGEGEVLVLAALGVHARVADVEVLVVRVEDLEGDLVGVATHGGHAGEVLAFSALVEGAIGSNVLVVAMSVSSEVEVHASVSWLDLAELLGDAVGVDGVWTGFVVDDIEPLATIASWVELGHEILLLALARRDTA